MARYILEDQNVDVDFLLGVKAHWKCQGTTTPFHVLLSLRPTDIEVDNLFTMPYHYPLSVGGHKMSHFLADERDRL